MFEAENAPQRGVIAFITNRKFLTGWPYAGLRKMMRERFDRIEIIDLRGDVNAGPRGDVAGETGVFNIKVGTAITLAIADGSKAAGALAEITYLDAWEAERFARRAKLDWLEGGAEAGGLPDAVAVERGELENFRPRPFQNGEWISLFEAFAFASSGLESKRDHIVYAPDDDILGQQMNFFLGSSADEEDEKFNSTDMNSAANAKIAGFHPRTVRTAGYRPLDRQQHYPSPKWNDRPRTKLSAAWGASNKCLFALPSNTGLGPATWTHANYPDRHAFRGSYGGYAFPLYDRRAGPDASNLNPALVAALSAAYGSAVSPEETFDAILALLSATSYTRTFAEDLEDVFPHIPFPATRAVFDRAGAIGREIRDLEAFARTPAARFRPGHFFRLASEPTGPIRSEIEPRDGDFALCADGSGRVTGVPPAVWSFAVSRYRVLPRWIEGRKGLSAETYWPELRDVAARIAELIHWFDEADIVLTDTLADTLRREALGFPDALPEDAEEGDD